MIKICFGNHACLLHMQRLSRQESDHFEISDPVRRQPVGKSESRQGNAGNVRSTVKSSRLALQQSVGGNCQSASLAVFG